jgi:hypothetical protein
MLQLEHRHFQKTDPFKAILSYYKLLVTITVKKQRRFHRFVYHGSYFGTVGDNGEEKNIIIIYILEHIIPWEVLVGTNT